MYELPHTGQKKARDAFGWNGSGATSYLLKEAEKGYISLRMSRRETEHLSTRLVREAIAGRRLSFG